MKDAAAPRARRWLAAGALAGVALAALALLRGQPAAPDAAPAPPDGDAVAWVDGAPISREAFARLAAQVARQRGDLELDAAARGELLERLIDEELLLREGLALGLARREPTARRAIVSAVVEGIGASGGGAEPDRAALEALYTETREQWRRPGGVRIEAALVTVPAGSGPAEDTAARARALALAGRARAGEPLAALAAAEAAAPQPPLPEAPVPLEALRARLAAPALEALGGLAPGEVSEPVRSAEGWWVVRLVAREPDEVPPLDAILPELRNVWIQRQHERAIRDHLDALRERVEIQIAEPEG
jgi:hypothetical protein